MNAPHTPTGTIPMSDTPRINRDGRVFGENGEPDYFIAGHFGMKLAFFIASLLIMAFGVWDLWGPLSRSLFGQRATGRVVYLVRQSPGETDETIRIRREIKEGDYAYATLFRPFVEVPFADGSSKIFQLAVASRQTPYALVNERVRVAFYPQDDVAYGIRHHRTWAFGCGFVMVGSTLVIISCFLLRMVGKKNYIDPEDPAQLELERQATALEQALHSEKAPTPEDMEPNPPPFAD